MTRTASPYDAVLSAPFGSIGIRMRGGALARVDLDPRSLPPAAGAGDAALAAACALERYLHDPASLPALELEMDGTPFQRRVWRALRSIPCGATLTYGDLARRLGTSARAVGGACRENPLPIVVPCHRVVAAGRAGGFMGRREGRALGIKSWLLRHEARTGTDERNGQG